MPISKRKKQNSRNKRNWRLLLDEYKNGKLSVVEFCKHHGISRQNFYYWQKRLQTKAKPVKLNPFIPVGLSTNSDLPISNDLNRKIESAIRINFGGGINIEFLQGCKPEELGVILRVLDVI